LTKNGQPYSLALTNKDGEPYDATAFLLGYEYDEAKKSYVKAKREKPDGEFVFDTTCLREEWRAACAKLKLGVYDEKTRMYRGAQLHDFRRTAATNMNAKGVNESNAMAVTGHKTSSMFKRYGIEGLESQRAALDAVTGA
jgi:integrase